MARERARRPGRGYRRGFCSRRISRDRNKPAALRCPREPPAHAVQKNKRRSKQHANRTGRNRRGVAVPEAARGSAYREQQTRRTLKKDCCIMLDARQCCEHFADYNQNLRCCWRIARPIDDRIWLRERAGVGSRRDERVAIRKTRVESAAGAPRHACSMHDQQAGFRLRKYIASSIVSLAPLPVASGSGVVRSRLARVVPPSECSAVEGERRSIWTSSAAKGRRRTFRSNSISNRFELRSPY